MPTILDWGRRWGRRCGQRLVAIDSLVRLHAVGFLALWPLLGAVSVGVEWNWSLVLGIVAICVSFNTLGAVLNDVVDLPVDQTEPLRRHSALVRGAVSRSTALALALFQIPIMVVLHRAFGFDDLFLSLLLTAALAMIVYDLRSKRCLVPPLIEVSEASCGALLVVWGACIGRSEFGVGGISALPEQTWLLALASAVFILFINAVHGGLRDLENDAAHGQRTTPLWLGCRWVGGSRRISTAFAGYAWSLQSLLVVSGALILNSTATVSVGGWLAWSALAAASAAPCGLLLGMAGPNWDTMLRVHTLIAPLPVLAAMIPQLGWGRTAMMLAIYFAPILLLRHTHGVLRSLLERASSSPSTAAQSRP